MNSIRHESSELPGIFTLSPWRHASQATGCRVVWRAMWTKIIVSLRCATIVRVSLGLCLAGVLALATASCVVPTGSRHQSGPLSEASPASVGMSARRLARIDGMCAEAVKDGAVPGVVALVARHGKIIYCKAFGLADSDAKRPLRRDDIFRIASQSKAITATAVMMLWEEARFQLDDPISRFIPEFKNAGVLSSFNEQDGTWTTVPAQRPTNDSSQGAVRS